MISLFPYITPLSSPAYFHTLLSFPSSPPSSHHFPTTPFFSPPKKTVSYLHPHSSLLPPYLPSSSSSCHPLPALLLSPQAGKIPPNSTVGRLLMEMVSRVPKIEGPKFDSMLNATMQVSITWCRTNLHDCLAYFFEYLLLSNRHHPQICATFE